MDMHVPLYFEVSGDDGAVADGAGRGASVALLRDCLVTHYARLHRRLSNHLGSGELASDCLHEAWLRLGDMALPVSVRHPEAYVYRTACNLALDQLREKRSVQSLDGMPCEIEVPDAAPSPDQVAEARSQLGALDRVLMSLPFRHRQILLDLRVHERTRRQVAATYGISTRAVDMVLRQTLNHCAALMP